MKKCQSRKSSFLYGRKQPSSCSPARFPPTTNLENKKNTACLEQYTSKLTYSICETNVD